jgi:hypothetical protein
MNEFLLLSFSNAYFFTRNRYGLSGLAAQRWSVRGLNPGKWKRFSLLHTHPELSWGPQDLFSRGTGSFLGVKRPGRVIDHLPPSIAQDKRG